jgi:iron complex transport system ATP-binding protein
VTSLLQLSNIDFRYSDRQVITGLSLELEDGSCTALIGPNGAGKTTLLRIAAGALAPTGGSVRLNGHPLRMMPRKQRSRLIALVPQELDVHFDFTVEQIVEQGRTPYLGLLRGPMREDREAVDRALDLADVTYLRHRVFNQLSGGERQRVKIALGLAQQPKLLLLDEPTQNLDIGRQSELIDLLHHLQAQGITIFASIHDLHLVPRNFSTVHLLHADQSLQSGTPEQVLSAANLTKAFRCTPGRHPLLMQESL